MSEIGSLVIRLQAETAQFRDDLGKVKSDLASLQGPAREAGESMGSSFTEARGSLMLTEEVLGVHLPRHLNSLIAQIPGLGAAFATMLPLIGVVAAIAIVAKLIEKHEALAAAIRKAAVEGEELAIKEGDITKSMELTNLKLADQISKLKGGVGRNALKEALMETSLEADRLAASFLTDFEKIDESID